MFGWIKLSPRHFELSYVPEILAFNMSSSGVAFPLALSDPVKPRTPSPQHLYPAKDHLSSPVKPVIPHFADHKRDEVQAFGYDKDLHQLAAFGELDFLDFLGVHEAFLNVDPPEQQPSGTQPSGKNKKGSRKKVSGKKDNGKKDDGKKASGKKASRKSSGKASAEANAEASGEGTTNASEFSFTNFVQAANTLTESMKEKREYLLLRLLSLDES